MLIIPVIDLSGGLVVHAKHGIRKSYKPIASAIANNSKPEVIISSFLELYPFEKIYIADLDAIQGSGTNNDLIVKLASEYKQCKFWLDAGIETILNKKLNEFPDNIDLVFGSENKLAEQELTSIINDKPELILSLDFDEHGLTENSYLIDKPSIWPRRLIVMSLAQVGSNKGVDIECLKTVIDVAGSKAVYAAGGIRNIDDLTQLKSMGVKGVLLATALHNGSITKEDLEDLLGDKKSPDKSGL